MTKKRKNILFYASLTAIAILTIAVAVIRHDETSTGSSTAVLQVLTSSPTGGPRSTACRFASTRPIGSETAGPPLRFSLNTVPLSLLPPHSVVP